MTTETMVTITPGNDDEKKPCEIDRGISYSYAGETLSAVNSIMAELRKMQLHHTATEAG